MRTQPIRPARIVFDAQGQPLAPDFNDRYHPLAGAPAQAEHVFLRGNGLPERWAGRDRFTVLELGFGLGLNFLATWRAWRDDPRRPRWLHYAALDLHPPTPTDLARSHATALPETWRPLGAALRAAWPPATANLHPVDLDGGRVRLLLGWGEVTALLPMLRLQADAFFLDGFAPGRHPERNAALWSPRVMQTLARRARPDATAATWCAARSLREALAGAGFQVRAAPGVGDKREITLAHFAPRYLPPPLPDGRPAGDARGAPLLGRDAGASAIVLGGGIAGACSAQALAELGWSVTVLEAHERPAQQASGNAAGLFHGTVNPDDGPYARLFRAAALQAAAAVDAAAAQGVPASTAGLLRLQTAAPGTPAGGAAKAATACAAMQALLQRLGLPPDYVQALDGAAASALAGVPLPGPAWFYPRGGWVDPAVWVGQLLAHPDVRWRGGVQVAALRAMPAGWQACDAAGRVIDQASLLVVAGGAAGPALLAPWQHPAWPLRATQGQVSGWVGPTPLRLPVAGDGYALPRGSALWCGATRRGLPWQPGLSVDAQALSADDTAHNLLRLQRLTGLRPPEGAALLGRSGLRLHTDDRLPLAGALADAHAPWPRPQAALAPRRAGLFVLGALGARGLTLAPLLARLIAAQASGTPWPLEQDLADAVDPARWQLRAARRAG